MKPKALFIDAAHGFMGSIVLSAFLLGLIKNEVQVYPPSLKRISDSRQELPF